jgi:hypothetical protein
MDADDSVAAKFQQAWDSSHYLFESPLINRPNESAPPFALACLFRAILFRSGTLAM